MKNYGLKVQGNIRVFTKTKEVQGNGKKKYSITDVWVNISEQNEDKTYFNKSMNLIFKKDAPKPENNTVISLDDASFMITGNDDYRKISLYVREWSAYVEELETVEGEVVEEPLPFK